MTAALKAYFPQVLTWFREKETSVFADFVGADRRSILPNVLAQIPW
jgi:hypothetical protein